MVDALAAAIHKLLQGLPGPAAVAATHLRSGTAISINGRAPFPAASVIKLPILATITAAAMAGVVSLDQEVKVNAADPDLRDGEDGSGVLRHLRPQHAWTIRELCQLMIMVSDNIASNALIDLLGGFDPVNRLMAEIGLTGTVLNSGIQDFTALQTANPVTAEDMIRLLQLLHGDEIPGSATALGIMEQQVYNGTLPLHLPASARILHKTGSLQGVVNDVGLVYPDEQETHAYAVAMLSKGQAFDASAQLTLAEISRMIFDHFAAL